MSDTYDLIVIGGGRAGTAAAEAARHHGLKQVLVVEHESQAARPEAGHVAAGAEVWWNSTAVGLLPGSAGRLHTVVVRRSAGTVRARAPRVVVATGAYEQPREAMAIPGSRPSGVMTPALALGLLDMGLVPGQSAVVLGGGSRAIRAAQRLAAAGVRVVAWVVPEGWEGPAPTVGLAARVMVGGIRRIVGYPRLTGVEVGPADGPAGSPAELILCDTLIVATRVIPNVTVLKGSPVEVDPETYRVKVDETGRTSVPGVFAAGTCANPDLEHRFSQEEGERVGALAAVS